MSTPEVTVIDYGVGNLLSVQRGLEHCGAKVILTANPEKILAAKRAVLPGVGAFANAMQSFDCLGLVAAIRELAQRQSQCAHARYLAAAVQQHALHVGVLDDRDPLSVRVLELGESGSLDTLAGIADCCVIGGRGDRVALYADADAGLVHHMKHVAEAAMGLTYQISDGAALLAEVERGVYCSSIAHLVVEAADGDVVALTQ